MCRPSIVDKILDIVADDGPYVVHITNDNMLRLFRLLKTYFDTCWMVYLDYSMGEIKLDKLLDYAVRHIYYVSAPHGMRIATINEVKSGVSQLLDQPDLAVSEEVTSYLNILLWTFTGQIKYYKRAGLVCTYTDGVLNESDYRLIIGAGRLLRSMTDWISVGGNFDRAITSLKMSKKLGSYKYPAFAEDEIQEQLGLKQLVYSLENTLYKPVTETQFKAKKIAFKIYKGDYKPTPLDISVMRRAYEEVTNGINKSNSVLSVEILELCDVVEYGRINSLIPKDDFAVRVMTTVTSTKRCSEKQLKILKGAVSKISKRAQEAKKKEEESNKPNEEANELLSMLNILESNDTNETSEINKTGKPGWTDETDETDDEGGMVSFEGLASVYDDLGSGKLGEF